MHSNLFKGFLQCNLKYFFSEIFVLFCFRAENSVLGVADPLLHSVSSNLGV